MESTLSINTDMDALRRRCAYLERELDTLRRTQRERLTLAADIHQSLLPAPVRDERIWVDVRYVPIEDVGGDYCQVRFPDRATCYITICDIVGHGIGPALLATRISSEVRYGIMYRMEPRAIAQSLEEFMVEYFQGTGLFLTFVAARIDFDRQEVTWSGAGHPSPLLLPADGREPQYLASQNPLIGLDLPGFDGFRQETVPLRPGDRFFLYTDGLYEVLDAEERQLGIHGFAEIARGTRGCDLFGVADRMFREIQQYQHGPNTDDQTLIVAELR